MEGGGPAVRGRNRRCRPTRSTNRTGDWHRHSSEIHRAIEARELNQLKKLLENGEKFCFGDGLNCFILAALSPQGTTKSRWKFVTEMLELDARGLNSMNEDGTTLLMIYCNSRDKINHLIRLGADVSQENQYGYSALLKSFLHPSPMLDAFEELLKCVKSDDEVQDLIDSLINNLANIAHGNLNTAVEMIKAALSLRPIDLSTFEQHPVERVIMEYHNDTSFNKKYCLLLKELVSCHLISDIPFTGSVNVAMNPEWKVVLEKFHIPDTVQLDLIGFSLYFLNIFQIASNDNTLCCDIMPLLKNKSIYFKSKEVLNPLVALLLNIFQSFCVDDPRLYPGDDFLEIVCYKSMISNITELSKEEDLNPISDADNILRLIAHLMAIASYDSSILITILNNFLIPNSSVHPYVFLAMCVENITSQPNHEQRLIEFYSNFLGPFWRCLHYAILGPSVLAVSGLPGGDKFVQLLDEMENLQDIHLAAKYVINKGKPAMTSMCSLKDLTRWAFRAAVAEFVKDKNLTVSDYIRLTNTKGYLPNTLANYVLLYQG